MIKQCTLWFAYLVLIASAIGATAEEYPDSKGRDFWLSFMPNWHNQEDQLASDALLQREHQLYVFIGAERPTRGRVTWRRNDGSEIQPKLLRLAI